MEESSSVIITISFRLVEVPFLHEGADCFVLPAHCLYSVLRLLFCPAICHYPIVPSLVWRSRRIGLPLGNEICTIQEPAFA